MRALSSHSQITFGDFKQRLLSFGVSDAICESGEEEMSNTTCILFAVGSIIAFCIVWYFTRDKRNEKI